MKTLAVERLFAMQTHFRTFAWANTSASIGRKSRNGSKDIKEGKPVPKYQNGYIWRKGKNWYGRWWDDVIENGQIVRKQCARKLAEYSDQYRTERDVRPLLVPILRPLNEGKTRPESTLSVAKFVDDHYFPFVEENYKPSTVAGYKSLWEMYLASRLKAITLRDFRTVDAATLLSDVYKAHGLGRTTLKHIKSFLSGVFTYAKNQGVLDGVNPIRDVMIPKRAAAPEDTHAASPDEVLSIMEVLAEAGQQKARAAVALMFFAGLRPGEARGVCWEDYDGKRLMVRQSVWHTYTTSPKTQSSVKPVPVIEPLTTILGVLREADKNPESGPILRGPSGKPLDLHNLANRVVIPTLKRCVVCKKIKSDHGKADHDYQKDESLPKWHGWYSLRRGVGTAIADLSNSLAAKGLLRHSSVSTTERHYIKDVPESTLEAMKMLETLCNPSATESETKPS
jgi:integrase